MSEAGRPTVIESDEHFTLASFRNLYLVRWRRQPDPDRARRMAEGFRAAARAHPRGVAVVVVIDSGTPPPDGPTRERIDEAMRADPHANLGLAYLVASAGFGAAAMRGVITGTMLLARPPYPVKVFATEEETASWVIERAGLAGALSRSELAGILRELGLRPPPAAQPGSLRAAEAARWPLASLARARGFRGGSSRQRRFLLVTTREAWRAARLTSRQRGA